LAKLAQSDEYTVQAAIGKYCQWVISSQKSGNMTDLTMYPAAKSSTLDTVEVVLCWFIIVQILFTSLSPDQCGKVLKNMGLMKENIQDTGETELSGVRNWQSMGQGMGNWFGAVGKFICMCNSFWLRVDETRQGV